MNRINERSWPALEPSPEFADKAVERMLAEGSLTQLRRIQGRRLAGLLLAAVFVTGAAFGISARAKKTGTSGVELAVVLPNPPIRSMQQRLPQLVTPSPSVWIVPVAPRASSKPIQPVTSALPATATSVTPSTTPRVPACQCQRGFSDMICDCY